MTLFLAMARREARLAWHHAAESLAALLFFGVVGVLFPLAIGPSPDTLRRLAPGLVWIAALLAALLPLERLFAADHEDGSLDQLRLSGAPPAAIAGAKAAGHWLTTGLPLALAAAPMAVMLGLPPRLLPVLLAGLLPGGVVLSLLGTAAAAVVLGARRGGALLPLLVLPLALPVLVLGCAASDQAALGLSPRPHLLLLAAMALAYAALAPLAAGAALAQDG